MNLANEERPHMFRDVLWQNMVKTSLLKQGRVGKFSQIYGLFGKFGCGKTTLARIIAQSVNCLNRTEDGEPCGECANCRSILEGSALDVIEIDGASHNSVAEARELIGQSVYRPVAFPKKVYIIDEVHMLSPAAFNALLKLLEEPPEWCVYILCTTEKNKLPATVLSRITQYEITAVPSNVMVPRIIEVAEKYGATIAEGAAGVIARHSDGSMRNAMRDLEKCLEQTCTIEEQLAAEILGTTSGAETFSFLCTVASNNVKGISEIVKRVFAKGRSPLSLVNESLLMLSNVILQFLGQPIEGDENYKHWTDTVREKLTLDRAFALSSELSELKAKPHILNSRETLMIRLLEIARNQKVSVPELLVRLNELEVKVRSIEKNLTAPQPTLVATQTEVQKHSQPIVQTETEEDRCRRVQAELDDSYQDEDEDAEEETEDDSYDDVDVEEADDPDDPFGDLDIPDLDDIDDDEPAPKRSGASSRKEQSDNFGFHDCDDDIPEDFKCGAPTATTKKKSLKEKVNDLLADPKKKRAYDRCQAVPDGNGRIVLHAPDEISYSIASQVFKGVGFLVVKK